MLRNAAVRAAQFSGRRFQSTTVNPVLAHAEQTFGKLPETAQREEINRLNEIMKADWHKVSIENKRAIPKPRTMTKEWQEASNEYARERNINPISGVSSEGYKGKGFVQNV
ncbi:cytochrome c oxidase [Coemansia brasiliensis]|uniref:Cytochrome c oxidase n=1 Tax=Coemansia brasiliensis TaxID=2650707 RepID=A0A9W8I6T1_9FUNG|nr:cytochrome c oxidase [Coemansia brasiliensis]